MKASVIHELSRIDLRVEKVDFLEVRDEVDLEDNFVMIEHGFYGLDTDEL